MSSPSPVKQCTSKVSQTFQANPLPTGPLKPGVIPQCGEKTIEKLIAAKVKTFEDLMAKYFFFQSDVGKFQDWLEEIGANDPETTAQEIARKFRSKR